jgi:hypothetical protein
MVLQFVAGPFISIAVLSFIFLMLNIIQIARNIRFYHLVEIADPDQILRFMNGNNQFASTPVLFLDLISLYNDKIYFIIGISLVA